MNFFSSLFSPSPRTRSGNGGKGPHSGKPGIRSGVNKPGKLVAKSNASPALATSSNAGLGQATPEPKLITSIGDFPPRQNLLSGVSATTPELRVPNYLQDKILAIRMSSSVAGLAYDPSATKEIKAYVTIFRGALSAMGLRVQTIFATSEVLASVRLGAEARNEGVAGRSLGNSDGVNLFKEWVLSAQEAGATDLHLRLMDGSRGEVMVRVDGELEPVPCSPTGIFTDNDVRMAIQASYEGLAEKKSNSGATFSDATSMSCMMDQELGIPNLRLRFSTQRGFWGPKAVARLLPSDITSDPMPFWKMGFSDQQIQLLEKAQRLETGIILQMGVTGSGKTTVAKTYMESHPRNGHLAMYQVADPIEFLIRNVHQIYVQRDLMVLSEEGKKDPYSEVIESLMRMDLDIVDVCEVRDFISARALANVGKSGHLAMGTLHADSMSGAINRLTDPKLGLSRQELTAGNLLAFMSYQALVPLLCESCKLGERDIVNHLADTSEGRYLGRLLKTLDSRIGVPRDQLYYRNPEGCAHCRKRGTKGLTIVAEMMMPEDGWLDLSAAGKDRDAIRWWRQAHSDKNLLSDNTNGKLVIEHTILKCSKGIVDPRNIERFGQLDALEILK